MFLKRLEIVGFKSFADKISVDFVPGVTAVVGPNGSGKSNIADSIRWVLGEQSAKSLRGAKMEDIIFAGSEGRKRLNLAEVTLILDNSDGHLQIDYSEVSVTRRVYRSGESEYLINRQPCRLKDIVDLFLDSGLGKEAYSIIGQGKVDEILNSKPEERRVIFEEAAGVLKYKTRKVTAEKRLLETEENLHRVEDILHELNDQVEPLQLQASIAKDYLHKREQLKDIDISLQVYEITELHEQWQLEKTQLETLQAETGTAQQKLTEMEERRTSLRERSLALLETYDHTQQQLLVISEDYEKNSGRRQLLEERKKHASSNKEQLERQLAEKETDYKALQSQLKTEEEKSKKINEEVKRLEQIVLEKQKLSTRSHLEIEDEIEQTKADYIEILNEQASLRNERRYLLEQKRQLEWRQERFLDDNEQSLTKQSQLHEQLEKAKTNVQNSEKQLEETMLVLQKHDAQLDKLREQYRKKEAELYETYQMTQRLQSRADVLAEMQADFSGFFQGVKNVLKAKDKLQGIVGAVAELVQVPKQYEVALEIALGGASQHIVVEDEAGARMAIQYLKKIKGGRATFLPRSVIKKRMIGKHELDRLIGNESFVGVAASLLSVHEKYESIMYHLLGNVLVAKDLQGANEVARLTAYRYRIVTLEGDVVSPGGAMTGGTVKQQHTPLLGRKREYANLREKITQLAKLTETLEQTVKQLKETIQSNEKERMILNEQHEQMRENAQEVQLSFRELTREVEHSLAESTRIAKEKENYSLEFEKIAARIVEIAEQLLVAEQEAAELETVVQKLENELQLQIHSKEKIQAELVNDQIKLATEKERSASMKVQFNRLKHAREKSLKELKALQDEYAWLIGELSSGADGTEQLDEKIANGQKQKEQLQEKLMKVRTEQEDVEHSYNELEQKIKLQQEQYAYIVSKCQKIEVKVNRIDVELDRRLTHLATEYELSFEAAQNEYRLTVDPEEARTQVRLIKLGIEELGTVNLGAIEEYDRVRERVEFLTEQQTDLVDAKTTLHEVIHELDEEMTTRFYQMFEQIRTHFRQTFRQLFGGGEADLILTEPEHLLTTGVEIIAKPTGKKMQHLGLLSGGERALTAIGLLFAILKARPVPFCVLDEVEAALDEANVGRFAHYLKGFSDDTQFIVITHRKGTMEEADALYGVTMQQSGVSNLVSVKLEQSVEMMTER